MVKVTKYNFFIALFMSLGGLSYGFAAGVFGLTIGQPGFYVYFKLDPTSSHTTSIIEASTAIFALGAGVGALTQGWTSDLLGRKRAILLAGALAVVGGACIAGSANVPMLIVFRFVQGVGIGELLSLSPLYIAETAPAHRRGTLVTIFSLGVGAGVALVGWISVATYYSPNQVLQWRLPLALAVLPPLGICIGVWWVPESPRWLVWKGRHDEAWSVLQKLHSDPTDDSDTLAHAEFTQVVRQVEFDKRYDVSFWQLFKRPSWRKRSLIAMLLFFASQSTGIYGIGQYTVIIYGHLGLTGVIPLVLAAAFNCTGFSVQFFSAYVMDRVNRRTMFLIGFPATAVCLLAEALLQKYFVGTNNHAANSAAVFFIFLFCVFYNAFIDPTSFVYTAELWPTAIRAKGMAVAWAVYFIGFITYTAPSATAFANIGWKMYMVWFSCNIVSTIGVYFWLPETAHKTLEEMGDLFGDNVLLHIDATGHLIEDPALVMEHVPVETDLDNKEQGKEGATELEKVN